MTKNSSRKSKFDLSKLKTYSIRDRKNLVTVKQFAKPISPFKEFRDLIDSFPDIYAGRDLKELAKRIANARRALAPVVFAMGGHVIKCGLSPIVIDLMRRKIVTAVSFNGSGAIHDYEIALIGNTSEDVSTTLGGGGFGMAKETAEAVNRAAVEGSKRGIGFGQALGKVILSEKKAQYPEMSIMAEAARMGIPATIHVSIGTDIIHMHHRADGAAIGEATMIDFRQICELVSELNGGVWCNIGCAVILPEVFLKAVSVASNLGFDLSKMCTANLDMIYHYRPETNVVRRPPGHGMSIIGRHEILLPLLRMAILTEKDFQ